MPRPDQRRDRSGEDRQPLSRTLSAVRVAPCTTRWVRPVDHLGLDVDQAPGDGAVAGEAPDTVAGHGGTAVELPGGSAAEGEEVLHGGGHLEMGTLPGAPGDLAAVGGPAADLDEGVGVARCSTGRPSSGPRRRARGSSALRTSSPRLRVEEALDGYRVAGAAGEGELAPVPILLVNEPEELAVVAVDDVLAEGAEALHGEVARLGEQALLAEAEVEGVGLGQRLCGGAIWPRWATPMAPSTSALQLAVSWWACRPMTTAVEAAKLVMRQHSRIQATGPGRAHRSSV